jgi:predicted porin
MQKKIIALAIAAAFSAPAFADVTVYGQAHLAYDQTTGSSNVAGATVNGGKIAPGASRLGFKGSEDLGDGLTALFQYETAVTLGTGGGTALLGSERDTYLGLAGGFGAVLVGRLAAANQYANDANFFGGKVGDLGNFTAAGNAAGSRVNNAIAYQTPKFGDFQGLVAYVPNTPESLGLAQTTANKASSYTLRGSYAANGVNAGLSYQNLSATSVAPSNKIFSLGGTYDLGAGKIGLQYVNDKNIGLVLGADRSTWALGGSYKVSDRSTIAAQYASAGNVSGTVNTGAKGFTVGYDYSLSKRTSIYAAYATVTNDVAANFSATGYAHGGVAAPGAGFDPRALSLGMIHNF